jgi:peroxiredoxin
MKLTTALIAIGALVATTVLAQDEIPGPAVGERFPHTLSAPDQHGTMRSLEDLYGDKGAAVFFVRSADWCPFCKRQLADVNNRLAEFDALGLSVITVSVDEVPLIRQFADEQDVGYTMLADPNGDINEQLGIRDEQYPVGSAQFGVPRPTLYIIDTSGTIRARYMEPTYRTRPDLDVVLSDARMLDL